MESRKNTQTPRMDRKALILTVVGAALVIAIIVIAVVLMQRSAGDDYRQNYEAAMEYYVAGDYDEAINSAKLAYAEDATEEAVLIIARSYAGKGDYESAVSELEAWTGSHGSGQEAGTLLEEYRSHLTDNTDEPDTETVTVAGTEYPIDSQTLVVSGSALTSADMSAIATLSELTSLSLNDCSLTDISALSSLSKLTDLSLEDNDITDLSPLSGLSSLKTLYLSGNENISSLEPLYGLDNLATLDIRGREITDEEFEALQTELPNCTILTDTPTETVTEITLGGQTFNSDVTSPSASTLREKSVHVISAHRPTDTCVIPASMRAAWIGCPTKKATAHTSPDASKNAPTDAASAVRGRAECANIRMHATAVSAMGTTVPQRNVFLVSFSIVLPFPYAPVDARSDQRLNASSSRIRWESIA